MRGRCWCVWLPLLWPAIGTAQAPKTNPKPAKDPSAKPATAAPLFADHAPLRITLTADFKAVAKNRDTLKKETFPARLRLTTADERTVEFPVQLQTRGHFRLLARNCSFVPLKVIFPKDSAKGTPFDKEDDLKLVTHCQPQDVRERYVLSEYAIYRLHNQITDRSFRARLVQATYVDVTNGKEIATRPAFFVESEKAMARRVGGKVSEIRGALFADLDAQQLRETFMFEYMIGNTDFSMYALHNIRMVLSPTAGMLPIAYDFDFSALAGTHYATPDPKLPIKTVRERLWRGPCLPADTMIALASRFASRRTSLLAVYDSIPGMDNDTKKKARDYLAEFFEVAASPRSVKRELVDGCEDRPGS